MFQSKQNGDNPLGEHRHGFNVCCCGTKDAPSNRPCSVSDLDDPTESLVGHARLTSPNDRGIDGTSRR
jgi:hypothetical protein